MGQPAQKMISLNEMLGDFRPAAATKRDAKLSAYVTIRFGQDAKARYDRLQEISGKEFGKRAREVLLKLMELAEANVS